MHAPVRGGPGSRSCPGNRCPPLPAGRPTAEQYRLWIVAQAKARHHHTHARLALKAGVPVKVISERLGHESPAFTLKQYAHVIPGMQAEAAAQVADLVDGIRPTA